MLYFRYRSNQYEDFELGDTAFESMLSLQKGNRAFLQRMFKEGKYNSLTASSSLNNNALYSMQENKVYILSGILADSAYNSLNTFEEKAAYYCHIIFHEMGHALDDYLSVYPVEKEADQNIYRSFQENICDYFSTLKTQRGNYLNGDLDQIEIIADYFAMAATLKMLSTKENIDYKKFFETHAAVFVNIQTTEYELIRLYCDVHPTDRERINGNLAQFDEFYQTFDISEESDFYVAPEFRIRFTK